MRFPARFEHGKYDLYNDLYRELLIFRCHFEQDFLLRNLVSEHATDIGNYLNEPDQVWRISEKKHDSSPKNVYFFENVKKKSGFRKVFGFSKIFDIFRTPQNRSIVVRFQFSALCDQISDRGTKNRALVPGVSITMFIRLSVMFQCRFVWYLWEWSLTTHCWCEQFSSQGSDEN